MSHRPNAQLKVEVGQSERQCKACGHYRPDTYWHGWCNRFRMRVCGIIKACLDARIEGAR